MKLKRLFFLILGCVCLALGCVGIVLPVLPTVPFFLATVFCFANSSEKLHTWFLGTELYQKHLDSFVKKKGMTAQTKAGILMSVTLLMAVGFFLMLRKALYIPCTILAIVWLCISAGSACHRGQLSHVYRAMGLDKKTAAGVLRVSFGPETTKEEIDALVSALKVHRDTRFPML